MNSTELANLIFPDAKEISYYEDKYKTRDLPDRRPCYKICAKSNGF